MSQDFPNLTVVTHPLVQHKLTWLRSVDTNTDSFRHLLREVSQMLIYEATRDLPTELQSITTPITTMDSPVISGKKLCLVSILRAGNGMLDGVLALLPLARVGHIGLYRDPPAPWSLSSTTSKCLPTSPSARSSWSTRCWPRATRPWRPSTASKNRAAPASNSSACWPRPRGVANMQKHHPDVPVITASLDSHLNEHGYIVPGLGDAGDRIFGTV